MYIELDEEIRSFYKISQQPENWENRNGPDFVQACPPHVAPMYHILLHGILVKLDEEIRSFLRNYI
jgi:hypothetical protein